MPLREERKLAARLDRVLDGRERADGELAALAALLERAAEPTRFEVPAAEVDEALARVRPRLPRRGARSRLRPVLGAVAFAAAAVAAVAALVLTRTAGLHVEGKALAALGGRSSVLRVIERIEPARPGLFPSSVRVGWIGSSGQEVRWDEYVRGRRVAETLLEGGRVSRYLVRSNVVIVGTSCRAFASGCAELVDPVEVYRRALQAGSASTRRTTYLDRAAYTLTLPVQVLPDAVRIVQRVTIDRRTFLPLRIEWVEERPGAAARAFSVILVQKVRTLPPAAGAGVFVLTAPGARVIQRVAPGRNLELLHVRRLSRAEAARLRPPLDWLGPDYFGRSVTAIQELSWNAGTAYRIQYGRLLTIWSYGALIPPEIASSRYVPAKTIPRRNGELARFYQAVDGRLVVELERPGRSVALIGPQLGKESLFDALDRLRPLR